MPWGNAGPDWVAEAGIKLGAGRTSDLGQVGTGILSWSVLSRGLLLEAGGASAMAESWPKGKRRAGRSFGAQKAGLPFVSPGWVIASLAPLSWTGGASSMLESWPKSDGPFCRAGRSRGAHGNDLWGSSIISSGALSISRFGIRAGGWAGAGAHGPCPKGIAWGAFGSPKTSSSIGRFDLELFVRCHGISPEAGRTPLADWELGASGSSKTSSTVGWSDLELFVRCHGILPEAGRTPLADWELGASGSSKTSSTVGWSDLELFVRCHDIAPEAGRTLLADWVLGASGSSKTFSTVGWNDLGLFVRCHGILPEAWRTLLADWVLGASGSSKTSSTVGWNDLGLYVRCHGILPEAGRTLFADWVLGASGSSKTLSRIGWPNLGPFVRCHGLLPEAGREFFGPLTGALKFMRALMISSRAASSSCGVNLLAGGLIGVSPYMAISAGGGKGYVFKRSSKSCSCFRRDWTLCSILMLLGGYSDIWIRSSWMSCYLFYHWARTVYNNNKFFLLPKLEHEERLF